MGAGASGNAWFAVSGGAPGASASLLIGPSSNARAELAATKANINSKPANSNLFFTELLAPQGKMCLKKECRTGVSRMGVCAAIMFRLLKVVK
jgi:hypothetical protein